MTCQVHPQVIQDVRALIASYDVTRLRCFQLNPHVDQDIRVQDLSSGATAISFPEVGYFNALHGLQALTEQVKIDVAPLYEGYAGKIKVGMCLGDEDSNLGLPVSRYVRLAGQLSRLHDRRYFRSSICKIIEPEAVDPREFAAMYLRAFDASPQRPDAALSNLERLCHWPNVYPALLSIDGELVGFCVLYVQGTWALLAGGGILPSFQRRGLHLHSIAWRLALARRLGCKRVASWTYCHNQSSKNLQEIGLEVIFEENIYELAPLQLQSVSRENQAPLACVW